MYIFWVLTLMFILFILLGTFCIFVNITPIFLKLIFFAIAACLPAFMSTYGHNTIVAGLFFIAIIGLFIAGLQILGIVNIGPGSSVL